MTPDLYGIYNFPEATDEEKAKATKLVTRMSSDADDRREILMALGLEPPDFKWIHAPGRRGKLSRVKVTPDGEPYPDPPQTEENTTDAGKTVVQ